MVKKCLFLAIFAFALVFFQTVLAISSPPPIPLLVYGNVNIDGQAAAVGTEISAEIDDVEVAVASMISEGAYFIEIPDGKANEGKMITFKVNGIVNSLQLECANIDTTPSVNFDLAIITTRSCSISNGQGIQVWDGSSWGDCIVESCNSGYHQEGNSCVADSSGGSSDDGSAGAGDGGNGGGGATDTTAPSISDINVTAGSNAASITWKTNESSISWLVYGTSTDYGQEAKTTSYITSHSVTLSDLSPETIYHYQLKSKDSNGNIGSEDDRSFTTLAEGEKIIGDINDDAKIDKYDFALMMSDWGKTGVNDSDLNGDNKVDKYDFALLMLNWSAI